MDSKLQDNLGSLIYRIFHPFQSHRKAKLIAQDLNINDEEQVSGQWIIGVFLAILSTVITAVGNHLVTLSAKLEKKEKRLASTLTEPINFKILVESIYNTESRIKVVAFFCRGSILTWIGGNIAIVLLGTVLTLSSLAYASQSLLAPLSGLTIVWNALLSTTPWFGNAILTTQTIVATGLTLMGCVFIVVSGPRTSTHYTIDDITGRFKSSVFFVLMVFSLALVVYLHRLVTLQSISQQKMQFLGGFLPGYVGGFSNLLAKIAVELFTAHALFSSLLSLTILIMAIVCAWFQLQWVNHALATSSPLVIVPVYQATLLLSSTLCGAVYFGDFVGLAFSQYLGFLVGVSTICVGVVMLASDSASGDEPVIPIREPHSLAELAHASSKRRHLGGKSVSAVH